MISKIISIDILQFLLKKKGYTKESLSKSMDISIKDINKILQNEAYLNLEHIENFSKKENYNFCELLYEAILPNHISEKSRKKLELHHSIMIAFQKKYKNAWQIK